MDSLDTHKLLLFVSETEWQIFLTKTSHSPQSEITNTGTVISTRTTHMQDAATQLHFNTIHLMPTKLDSEAEVLEIHKVQENWHVWGTEEDCKKIIG